MNNLDKETKLNEFGDKIGKPEICQGVILFLSALGVICCACFRGCQEIKRYKNKGIEKAKVIQTQNIKSISRVFTY